MAYTKEQLDLAGRIVHHCWVSYQIAVGQDYNIEPDAEDLTSQEDGFKFFLGNPNATPEDNHKNWMACRRREGWVYGPVKDKIRKTHPDLVPYEELPEVERRKDEMDNAARRFALSILDRLH